MNQEKEIIVKGWEKLEDEVIIKEVATKGKHVNLCIKYLSERNELSMTEAKNYFLQKVNAYVYRLLSNRQLFKAEHILNNIDRISKYVFYQIASETQDAVLREYIMQHLKKHIEEEERLVIDSNWHLYSLLKVNVKEIADVLEEVDKNYSVLEVETMSFNTFCGKSDCYRNSVAVNLFFRNKETTISPVLNKYTAWNYLVKNSIDNLLKTWIDISYCIKWKPDFDLQKISIDIYDDCRFNETLRQLFSKWQIDDKMVKTLSKNRNLCRNEILLNKLARFGKFVDCEANDCIQIIKRLFTTETFKQNNKITQTKQFKEGLSRFVVENNIFHLLNESFIDQDYVEKVSGKDECNQKHELNLFTSMKNLLNSKNSKQDLLQMSQATSSYLSFYNNTFVEENPVLQLFEYFLDETNEYFPANNLFIERIPHLHNYLKRLKDSKGASNELNLFKLVKIMSNIDLKMVKIELFEDFDTEDRLGEQDVPHFGHMRLCNKYSTHIKFSYMHYIKQYRSSYAAYLFFIEQLRDYSKITQIQIMNAAGNVAEIAFNNYENRELVSHCIAFIEMLGINTVKIRAYLRCLNVISDKFCVMNICNEKFVEYFEESLEETDCLISDLEAATIFCESNSLPYPEKYLKSLAKNGEWYKFTLFVQYLNYSLDQVVELCRDSSFECNVGVNLVKAFKYYKSHHDKSRKGSMTPRERRRHNNDTLSISTNSSESEITNSRNNDNFKLLCPKYDIDVFAVILLCSNDVNGHLFKSQTVLDYKQYRALLEESSKTEHFNQSTFLNFLKTSNKMKWPLLAVFAAMINYDNVLYCWLTWLTISSNYNATMQKCSSAIEHGINLVEYCVKNGYIQTLYNSICIFYPKSHFKLFTKYLSNTYKSNFSAETTNILKEFLQNLHENENTILFKEKSDVIMHCIKLLIIHLSNNFHTLLHQQFLLKSLSDSEISYFTTLIDFSVMFQLANIMEFTEIELNFGLFYDNNASDNSQEYEKLCDKLIEGNYHEKAIQVAELLKLSTDNIIYEYWVYNYENDNRLNFECYEKDLERYDLNCDLLLNYYVHVAKTLSYENKNKYVLLKKALDLIKKFNLYPSETFDRDKLEYEMILSYLHCDQNVDSLELYNSHYYEKVFKKERGVLYNTFLELKEVAAIDELTVSNAKLSIKDHVFKLDELILKLLREGDIVQALRYQAMFDQRPVDLHFIVFCMALAESLVTLYDLPKEERQLLNDDMKKAANRFNKRTLRANRISQTSTSSSPSRTGILDASDISTGAFEFEEIPPREKQDILESIQGLASKIKNGIDLAQRIVLTYRASIYLDRDYNEIIKMKDFTGLLEDAIDNDCFNKLVVFSDIMTASKMSPDEIADFMSSQIVSTIIKTRFYIISSPVSGAKCDDLLWGYNIDKDFHLLLELCPNTTMLGNYLLKYCDALKYYKKLDKSPERDASSYELDVDLELLNKLKVIMRNQVLSLKKQNTIIVALLIKAHECFVHECSMEGIVNVLQRTKLLNVVLTNAKSWSLIVKLLIGIRRYREMYYCFETLIKNDQFESLLGQFDEQPTNGLKNSITSYLHEHCPENNEYFRLAALHFLMYKELAQMWENEAKSTIAKVLSDNEKQPQTMNRNKNDPNSLPRLKCSNNVISELMLAMDGYTHATENYLMDNKLNLAQKSATNAELVAMQINLVKKAMENNNTTDADTCISVLNVSSKDALKYYVNNCLSVPEALILSRSYNYEINWAEALYLHTIISGDDNYLSDYLNRMPLTDSMIENLVKNFQLETNITKKMEESVAKVVEMVSAVTLKYRLASLLGLKRTVHELINNQCLYYLKDTDYGRNTIP